MTTFKELAEAYRLVLEHDSNKTVRAVARNRIDFLDPPKPTWPEGTIAWVTYTHAIEDGHPYQALAQYDASENEWVMERTHTGADCTVVGDNVTKVEPLRVLGDDEIAVKRTYDIDLSTIDVLIDVMAHCADRSHVVTRDVLGLIRDALAAESGDAK